jgi:hypothetical protein
VTWLTIARLYRVPFKEEGTVLVVITNTHLCIQSNWLAHIYRSTLVFGRCSLESLLDTGYSEWGLSLFSSVPPGKCWASTGPRPLPYPFQFTEQSDVWRCISVIKWTTNHWPYTFWNMVLLRDGTCTRPHFILVNVCDEVNCSWIEIAVVYPGVYTKKWKAERSVNWIESLLYG